MLSTIQWQERTEKVEELLQLEDSLTTTAMIQGYEAEVVGIQAGEDSYVLKVWNKHARPDIRMQYQILTLLIKQGVSVSTPLGWGLNEQLESVLLTTYEGVNADQLTEEKLKDIVKILIDLHSLSMDIFKNIDLPKYDFVSYSYPGIEHYTDLYPTLQRLMSSVTMEQNHLIHGDFHLFNVLEKQGRYTLIDWTNAQLGDIRYDFAWSWVLQQVYIPEKYSALFRSFYLAAIPIPQAELDIFEALAGITWMLRKRLGHVPELPGMMDRWAQLVQRNPYLQEINFIVN
ncbi:aminoglycoside phosphotransferase family protein [Paenibacillus shirakamiensis]|uniref:aminoglycoside phosphotransferase family protein n=1 Tax=Paenibacillus shirakamiensis TaxID=1265935 RepID=UPI003159FD38